MKRLLSLDFMRGLIMVLLMLESTGMYERLNEATENTWAHTILTQFFHHPWNGLRLWDLIQPGFMFIAGAALALSLQRQQEAGVSWSISFRKVLKRSGLLFFFGVLNYAVRPKGLSFELWNVLTQLSFTTLVAFLIYHWPAKVQIAFSVGLLVLTEVLYRFINISGFDLPFTDQQNFGNYMDLLLMNKINSDGWVAINCIPTACHTIWGALAGKVLFSERESSDKIKLLAIPGACILVLGIVMDQSITPIIKRIATSSFTLASGGWCLLALAFFFYWIDVKNHRRHLLFFTVVGMNSLFIYLFFEIVGLRWFDGYIDAITFGLPGLMLLPHIVVGIISSTLIFALEWWMCFFLYRKNVFIKI